MNEVTFVYIDRKPDGTPFYVGIGNANRVAKLERKNAFHANVVKKYPNWRREVLASMFTWEAAADLERDLIASLGRRDLKTGILVNLTDGGEGSLGIVRSEETVSRIQSTLKAYARMPGVRESISRAVREKVSTPEARSALSQRMKVVYSDPFLRAKNSAIIREKLATDEVLNKMRALQKEIQNRPEVKLRKNAAIRNAFQKPEVLERSRQSQYLWAARKHNYATSTGYAGDKRKITNHEVEKWEATLP